MTFESEEGYQRARAYNETVQKKFLGQNIELCQASEPTDIIWENRHFTPKDRSKKRCIIYLVIVIMLMLSASVIYACTTISLRLKFKYPTVKCSDTQKDYSGADNKVSASDLQRWTNDAMKEFDVNTKYEKNGRATHYQGIMQCYCKF
jgi:hypothetical protein